jgi:2-dehydro-3-deoxyphosphogalactonate aldolase
MTEFNEHLQRCPYIAILRGIRPEEVAAVADVLLGAGFKIVEIPLNSPDALASIGLLAERLGRAALVGAGTVLDVHDVERVADAGGRLVVAPNANADVVRAAKKAGLFTVPGFATPTEAFSMIEAGADALKLFPAEASSPAVLAALRAVLPRGMGILPVGGIRVDSVGPWWAAGAAGFGLGSALYRAGNTAAQVSHRARAFMQAIDGLRAES